MGVKRLLKINGLYIILEILPPAVRRLYVGFKCRVCMQLADDSLPQHFVCCEAIMLGGSFAGQRQLLQGVRLRRYTDEREVCRCKAYSFPHHARSGRCYASSEGPFCGSCGKPTDVKVGKIEKEMRSPSRPYVNYNSYASACCEAEVFDDANLTIPYSED